MNKLTTYDAKLYLKRSYSPYSVYYITEDGIWERSKWWVVVVNVCSIPYLLAWDGLSEWKSIKEDVKSLFVTKLQWGKNEFPVEDWCMLRITYLSDIRI